MTDKDFSSVGLGLLFSFKKLGEFYKSGPLLYF